MSDLSVTEFAEQIKQPNTQILDVRTPAEFAEGHLNNSLNIDFQSENFDSQIQTLDKSKSYAVYCRSGVRSAMAAEEMSHLGFKFVSNMVGGILEWSAAGLPITK